MELKTLAVVVLAAAAVFLAYYFLTQPVGISKEQFERQLLAAGEVFIIEDLRGADETVRVPIMQCGTDYAAAVAGLPVAKNITIMVIEGDDCLTSRVEGQNVALLNYSAQYCEALSKSGVAFHITQGSSSSFYSNLAAVGISGFSECNISFTVQ